MEKEVRPYEQNDSTKKEQVRQMFDAIAPRYDVLNHSLSVGVDRLWRRHLVRGIDRAWGDPWGQVKILDVATGTGDLAMALRVGVRGARVTGLDLSKEMVEIGRRKLERRGLHDVRMEVGDAEALPFESASFDIVTSAFGVRNFGNLLAGLREMVRVVRPGGEVVILEFSKVETPILRTLYHFYFTQILPRIGAFVSKDSRAYEYLPESVDAFSCGEAFLALMRQAGLSECRFRKLSFGIATIYRGRK